MKVKRFFRVPIDIDGEDEPIVIRVKRLNVDEHSEFNRRWDAVGQTTDKKFFHRGSSEAEQARDDEGEFVIPMEKLIEQKIESLSGDELDRYRAMKDEDEVEARDMMKWAFVNFVTVESGLIEIDDSGKEQTIESGIDLLRIFGSDAGFLNKVMIAIWAQNELDDEKKSRSPSAIVLSHFLTGSALEPTGPKPGPTVESAETSDTAIAVGVSSPSPDPSSETKG